MKRMFSYVCVAFSCCLSFGSCIYDNYDVEKDSAQVELRIDMPSSQVPLDECSTRAGLNEVGNSYENTIVDISDIHIFLFDQVTGVFMGKATDLVLLGADDATIRVIKGRLPSTTLGKKVNLVFMANYGSRGATPTAADQSDYMTWKQNLFFSYGDRSWSPDDLSGGKYIPMSGEAVFTVNNRSDRMNYANISLTRAIAKVRVKVRSTSRFSISSLQTFNASSKSFSLEQTAFSVPETPGQGLYLPLQFEGQSVAAGETIEFFIPEQDVPNQDPAYRTFLQIGMTKDGSTTLEKIDFKDYLNKVEDVFFPIERNYIYEFIVDKKEDESMVDVSVSVEKWNVVEEIISDYE